MERTRKFRGRTNEVLWMSILNIEENICNKIEIKENTIHYYVECWKLETKHHNKNWYTGCI